MQEQNGLNPSSPQPHPMRGPAGYVPRQASYMSSNASAPLSSQPSAPTMADAAEAAQRLVQPTPVQAAPVTTPPAPVTPAPIVPQPPVAAPRQFDFVPSPQPQPSIAPAAPSPVPPTSSPFLTNVPAAPKLPTDLPSVVIPDVPSPDRSGPKLKLVNRKTIAGLVVFVLLLGAGGLFTVFRSGEHDDAQVQGIFKTSPLKQDNDGGLALDAQPSESGNAPSVDYYRTASSYPRVLRIAKTNTEARVLALNIAVNGALKSPGNIFDAGWYKDSAKPGEDGVMVMDAHASGPTRPGVFSNLGKLAKGDKIEVERGDGKKFTYTVQAVKVFEADKLDMSSVMVPYVPGKQGLNLITAGGKFNNDTNKFEPRTVVYAVL